jgi:C-terminal processing protease CtpA/Prc
MGYGPGGDYAESPPPTGGRPSSGGNAGILATLVPTGFRQPHMIESMAQGGPSHASGQVQPGDLLLEVDSADVRTLSLKEIQSKIIGRSGTQVTLTLQRGKRNFPHKVTLTR